MLFRSHQRASHLCPRKNPESVPRPRHHQITAPHTGNHPYTREADPVSLPRRFNHPSQPPDRNPALRRNHAHSEPAPAPVQKPAQQKSAKIPFKKTQQIHLIGSDDREYQFTTDKSVKLLQGHYYCLYLRKSPNMAEQIYELPSNILGFEELTVHELSAN